MGVLRALFPGKNYHFNFNAKRSKWWLYWQVRKSETGTKTISYLKFRKGKTSSADEESHACSEITFVCCLQNSKYIFMWLWLLCKYNRIHFALHILLFALVPSSWYEAYESHYMRYAVFGDPITIIGLLFAVSSATRLDDNYKILFIIIVANGRTQQISLQYVRRYRISPP